MAQHVLYSFRRCPYAIRARLALHCAQIPFELVEVSLRNKPAEMLALSPKATVPVLQLADGHVIDQSLGIMQWALTQHDPDGWLTQASASEMQGLIDINDQAFKSLLDRYKYAERHPEKPRSAYRDEAVELVLKPLNDRLTQHSYLFGKHISLADMAIAPLIRQFAQVDPVWFDTCELQALRQWLVHLINGSLFRAVMAKTHVNAITAHRDASQTPPLPQ